MAAPTSAYVEVRVGSSWEPTPYGMPPEVRGVYRVRDGAWERRVDTILYLDGEPVAAAIDAITHAAQGLTDATLGDPGSSSEYAGYAVMGWRPATDEEIMWAEKAAELKRRKDAECGTREVERAKATLRAAGIPVGG